MTILRWLEQWKANGAISEEQYVVLNGVARGEPVSLFLELNILLYGGILAFIGGLGWSVAAWSQAMGDAVVLTVLSAGTAGGLWYCFSRAPVWSPQETPSGSLLFDYVLYFSCLTASVELAHLKAGMMLAGPWELYLLVSAVLFFFLAYRFDNRFVLALGLSALAGALGLSVSRWPNQPDSLYRQSAVIYSAMIVLLGGGLARRGIKQHFFDTYLNVAANVLFWALVSGVFEREGYLMWLVALLAACGASLAWGLKKRQFPFVAYAAVYGYVGVSAVLVRNMRGDTAVLSYFVCTGAIMLVALVVIARRFGREA